MLKKLTSLVSVLVLSANGAGATLVIDNADDVTSTWTLGGNAHSLGTISGGVSGDARKLVANPSSGQSIFTSSLSGDLSGYMSGSIEFDYKTLGTGATVDGPFTPAAGYPRFLQVRVAGGDDPANQWIEFNVTTWSSNSGLAWDVSSEWHTIKLALVDGLAVRAGSEFDGAAATTTTLPVVAKGSGMSTQADVNDMWENVTLFYVGQTHYQNAGPFAAVAMDNLRLVPEPSAMGLVVSGVLLASLRRRTV